MKRCFTLFLPFNNLFTVSNFVCFLVYFYVDAYKIEVFVCETRRKWGSALVKSFNQIYEKEEIIAFKYQGSNVVQNDICIICTSKQRGASGY